MSPNNKAIHFIDEDGGISLEFRTNDVDCDLRLRDKYEMEIENLP